MHGQPPRDQVTVRDHYARDVHWQIAVAELVEMQNVWLGLFDQRLQVCGRLHVILLAFLHPLQAEARRPIVEAMEVVHPGGLFG